MAAECVRVVMGKIRLLFPAAELLAVEPMSRVDAPVAGNPVRTIDHNGLSVPVAVFDGDLRAAPTQETRRRLCAVLREGDSMLGLACDEAGAISAGGVRFHALPPCMQTADAIIPAIAVYDGALFSVCKITDLLRAGARPPASPGGPGPRRA